MANNEYSNKWQRNDMLGKGGQGLTYHCRSIPDDGSYYALKLLKDNKDEERRERMFVEVSALQILNHPNIPAFVDSNASSFKEKNVTLYLVTEYVPGQTLQEFIESKGLLRLDIAVKLTLKLADIVLFCHYKDFCHRDIKPDNIILKNDDPQTPFLIDFGLSFNEEIAKQDTPSWQHVGNKFLSLPELRVNEGNKRDKRSDVTMLCGILLFCLTGINPTDLLDEKQTKPHRREKAKLLLKDIGKPYLDALNQLFDIGFNVAINDRWPSAESLIKALNDILNMETNTEGENDVQQKLEKYKNRIEQRVDFKQLDDLQSLFTKCDLAIRNANAAVINQLKPTNFSSIHTNHNVDYPKQLFSTMLGVKHPYSENLTFFPQFNCYINGSELVIEGVENMNRQEIIRHPLNEEINWNEVEESLSDYYINGVTSKED